jgi:regulator of ribonuclease activity B
MSNQHDAFHSSISPEEEACLRIIMNYQRALLTLEEAAPRLREALRAVPGGMTLEMSPRTRRLFAEVARLDGRAIPTIEPDPDRHADGGRVMLDTLFRKAWRAVSNHSRANQPLRIDYHFAAATESTARAIVDWLENHGQQRVELRSPEEADADDWIIRAATPPLQWSEATIQQWSEVVRAAPLGEDASFRGWSV